ncbi:MAG TPA: hypothetical protein VFL82_12325 [Thermomicrobiales bacterium]|nr:hypothetical protein [Thermomicrobiales bacterium]
MDERQEELKRLSLLLSPAGQELLDRLRTTEVTRDTELRVATALRRAYPPELVSAALWQHELRVKAERKFSRAREMYFTRPGLEQASSEVVARYRAMRFAPYARIADLCTGIGGDLLALAPGHSVLAVDRDPVHLEMALLNARVYDPDVDVRPLLADVRDVDLHGVDAVFIDPARRDGGQRHIGGESEPPFDWCLTLADQVPAVGIKAAPGLAHELVPEGWEIEFVALDRDLKEAAVWSPALATTSRRATILPDGATLRAAPGPPVSCAMPGAYLLDPNPAVTRAGLVEELARDVDGWKIDEQIAFLSTKHSVVTPFARTLQVIESMPWHQKRIVQRLRALNAGAVDIRRRGLAGDVEAFHKRLKLTGDRRFTLVMTRVLGKPWALICADVGGARG